MIRYTVDLQLLRYMQLAQQYSENHKCVQFVDNGGVGEPAMEVSTIVACTIIWIRLFPSGNLKEAMSAGSSARSTANPPIPSSNTRL